MSRLYTSPLFSTTMWQPSKPSRYLSITTPPTICSANRSLCNRSANPENTYITPNRTAKQKTMDTNHDILSITSSLVILYPLSCIPHVGGVVDVSDAEFLDVVHTPLARSRVTAPLGQSGSDAVHVHLDLLPVNLLGYRIGYALERSHLGVQAVMHGL